MGGMMLTSKVTAKGQTTLPKNLRKSLQIGAGDILNYVITPDGAYIQKARPVSALSGILKRDDTAPVSVDDMNNAIRKGALSSS